MSVSRRVFLKKEVTCVICRHPKPYMNFITKQTSLHYIIAIYADVELKFKEASKAKLHFTRAEEVPIISRRNTIYLGCAMQFFQFLHQHCFIYTCGEYIHANELSIPWAMQRLQSVTCGYTISGEKGWIIRWNGQDMETVLRQQLEISSGFLVLVPCFKSRKNAILWNFVGSLASSSNDKKND